MELKYLPFMLLLPVCFAFIAKAVFRTTISTKEMCIHFILGIVFSVVVFNVAVYAVNYDSYYVHGEITDKTKDRVSCSHTRRVCTGSGKNETCRSYKRHSYDIEYRLITTIGNYEISPPDSQGLIEPATWQDARISEHYTDTASFQNYLANSQYSIMNKKYENIVAKFPSRPSIYNTYQFDPVVNIGANVQAAQLNSHLKALLKKRGHAYNLNIVFMTNENAVQTLVLTKYWKPVLNDILVIFNVENGKVTWSEAIMYADNIRNERLTTDVRLDFTGMSPDTHLIDKLVSLADSQYHRPGEEEFDRLKFEMELSMWHWISIFVINLIFNIAISIYMHKHEL